MGGRSPCVELLGRRDRRDDSVEIATAVDDKQPTRKEPQDESRDVADRSAAWRRGSGASDCFLVDPNTVTAGEGDDWSRSPRNSINSRRRASVAVRAPRPECALRGDAALCTYQLHQRSRSLRTYPQRLPETLGRDRTLMQLTMSPILLPRPLQQLIVDVHAFWLIL